MNPDDYEEDLSKALSLLALNFFKAGKSAYQCGKKRTDYPIKKAMHRWGLHLAWQMGWDVGAYMEAWKQGMAARHDESCPYTNPFLADGWWKGWHTTHHLKLVVSTKNSGLA